MADWKKNLIEKFVSQLVICYIPGKQIGLLETGY